MKKIIFQLVFLFFFVKIFSQVNIAQGDVSGIWKKQNSPYNILGNITIPDDSILIIEPGVTVKFFSWSTLTVNGTIIAKGTLTDSIKFEHQWLGISFKNKEGNEDFMSDNDSSVFTYCEISHVNNFNLSAISIENFSKVHFDHCYVHHCFGGRGGAFYYKNSDVNVSNCKIEDNISGWYGGGLFLECSWDKKGVLVNNVIRNNSANGDGGGIYSYGYCLYLINNVIVQNSATRNGGGTNDIWCDNKYYNNTICDNIAGEQGGGIFSHGTVNLVNSILWGNKAKNGNQYFDDFSNSFSFSHCVIEEAGAADNQLNCIFFDPLLNSDYGFAEDSRCLNSGTIELDTLLMNDIEGNNRVYAQKIDIGAFEFQDTAGNRKPIIQAESELIMMYNSVLPVTFIVDDPDKENKIGFQIHVPKSTFEITDANFNGYEGSFNLASKNFVGTDTVIIIVNDNTGTDNSFDSLLIIIQVIPDNYTIANDTISENTNWCGIVLVKSDIIVKEGATLSVCPGTTVLFNGEYKIIIEGNIEAIGEKENRITFTSKDTTGFYSLDNKGWLGIALNNKNDNNITRFRNCDFLYTNSLKSNSGYVINVFNQSTVLFENCLFKNNISGGTSGLNISNSASVKIDSCGFENNFGRGVSAIATQRDIVISNCYFKNNYSESGGTIFLDGERQKVINCMFMNNSGDEDYVDGTGITSFCDTLTVIGCVFHDNTSAFGIIKTYDTYLDVVNCTFSQNKNTRECNAIHTIRSNGHILNSIFWNPDLWYEIDDHYDDSSSFVIKNCLFSDTLKIGLPYEKSELIMGSPLLNNLFSGDVSLQVSSPCINTGNEDTTGFSTYEMRNDILGNSRINGGRIDIGALEFYANYSPTDILLSDSVINEFSTPPYFIGSFKAVDENKGDFFTYHFYNPDTTVKNNLFKISSDSLIGLENITPDEFESVKIGIVANDQHGDSIRKVFTLVVNRSPSGLSLSDSVLAENNSSGHIIGTLSAADDGNLTYLIKDIRFKDLFDTDGTDLIAKKPLNHEDDSVFNFLVFAVDEHNCSVMKFVNISVTNVNEAPYQITLSNNIILEGSDIGTLIGIISFLDEDVNDEHIISFSDADNFSIHGDSLLSSKIFYNEEKKIYTISVKVTDLGNLSCSKNFDIVVNDKISKTPENLTNMDILCYPNPAKENLTILLNQNFSSSIALYDVTGKMIFFESVKGEKEHCINMRGFPDGIYILHLETPDGRVQKKVVKSGY